MLELIFMGYNKLTSRYIRPPVYSIPRTNGLRTFVMRGAATLKERACLVKRDKQLKGRTLSALVASDCVMRQNATGMMVE